jgi:hypothetical protein
MSNAPSTRPQIVGQAQEAYDKLPQRMKADIDDWLEDRQHKVLYGKFEVMEAWLEWNGILGYDEDFRQLFYAMQ